MIIVLDVWENTRVRQKLLTVSFNSILSVLEPVTGPGMDS